MSHSAVRVALLWQVRKLAYASIRERVPLDFLRCRHRALPCHASCMPCAHEVACAGASPPGGLACLQVRIDGQQRVSSHGRIPARSVEQRRVLIRRGLRDRKQGVREAAQQLLAAWLDADAGSSVPSLLRFLHVEQHEEEAELAVRAPLCRPVCRPPCVMLQSCSSHRVLPHQQSMHRCLGVAAADWAHASTGELLASPVHSMALHAASLACMQVRCLIESGRLRPLGMAGEAGARLRRDPAGGELLSAEEALMWRIMCTRLQVGHHTGCRCS